MNYEDLANGLFINCEFKYNNGCAIQNNGQSSQWYWKYYNYTFKNCIMVSSGQNSFFILEFGKNHVLNVAVHRTGSVCI